AQGGTLFLDEIGDVPAAIQVKLLRLLQEKTFERLGGTATLRADVRFVAATHRPLEELVRAGTFREDLFYRLSVLPIFLPPLRERREEIPALARLFCEQLGPPNGRPGARLSDEALALLARQPWPGNVRQLQNLVERLIILAEAAEVSATEVERELSRGPRAAPVTPAPLEPGSLDTQRRAAEREAIERALAEAKGNRTAAARLLGVSRRTLYNKLDELGVG
ncbi:MAG: sigma 54-interacting transcriptional regulator, partial [Deltaproteobacteria bacterium]